MKLEPAHGKPVPGGIDPGPDTSHRPVTGPGESDAARGANDPQLQEMLNKIGRLLRKAERDARLLDGRDFKMRPYAEAYRLLDILSERNQA